MAGRASTRLPYQANMPLRLKLPGASRRLRAGPTSGSIRGRTPLCRAFAGGGLKLVHSPHLALRGLSRLRLAHWTIVAYIAHAFGIRPTQSHTRGRVLSQ